MLSRSVFRSGLRAATFGAVTAQRSCRTIIPLLQNKRYASSWDKSPEDLDAHVKVQKLMDEIHSHPSIVESLENLNSIMREKKLIDPESNEPPSIMQMVKLMMDKDIREAMQKFKSEMDKSGINLGPDQLGPLMKVLGIEKK
ncbi:Dpc13p [Kluyveromyces lactis]|uniref:KLLA0F09339p n=1 Tax=Kluyveromyces lactis (strain ATCC 8585 / CBS 2359 / DSM 70799 / NBRC 1267 / NRRL Y-1140 / WM37) TaxID=284590 RepID=Q6CKN4_KLULA|nr:uncharacterized protein KLLA0_F09339g [Kluyveromyces lactis]CAG98213.1 KLLA0F09339p [Kluyveromyces lactis]|eukprot:XP_455505.1 uncharacterized protein KLLA0_F09339g [Kluyveromyces lactis]